MKSPLLQNGWAVPWAAACAAGLYLFVGFLPQQRTLAQLGAQLATQKAFVAQTSALAPAVAATQQEVDKTEQYDTAWRSSAPSDTELAALFGRIHALAKAAGVTIVRFNPDDPVSLARIRRIPVVIGCAGRFGQIARFLCDIERLPHPLWIERLRMEATGENREDVHAEMTLAIFTDNPENSDQVNPAS